MCQEIIEHMTKGLSKEAACAKMGIHKDTLYDWCNPESPRFRKRFSDAVKEGEQQSLAFWEILGIKGAMGKLKNFSAASWIFNMKNRHGWRDKQEISGPAGGPIIQKVIVLPSNGRNDRDVDTDS